MCAWLPSSDIRSLRSRRLAVRGGSGRTPSHTLAPGSLPLDAVTSHRIPSVFTRATSVASRSSKRDADRDAEHQRALGAGREASLTELASRTG